MILATLCAAAILTQKRPPPMTARLGGWNVERLSSIAMRGFPELQGAKSLPPRTTAQLLDLGKYLRDEVGIAATMIFEVEPTIGDDASTSAELAVIVGGMGPTWLSMFGKEGGEMRIALIYDTKRIKLKLLADYEVPPFTIENEDIFERDPLVAWIALLDEQGREMNDLLLIGCHLKSGQTHDDNHMVAMAKLLTEMNTFLKKHKIEKERDVLIVGDMNDSAYAKKDFRYMFSYLEAKGYTHVAPTSGPYPATRINGSKIDHMFASASLRAAILPGSFKAHQKEDWKLYRQNYSDHFPISAAFKVLPDKD